MAKLGELELQVVEEETIEFSNNLLSKPIEDRNEISDHITHQPLAINIKFIITGVDVNSDYNALIKMRDSNDIYDYWGVRGYYSNMAIKSLSIPRNSNISNGFQGTLNLQQIRVVEQKSKNNDLGRDPATGNQAQGKKESKDKRGLREDEVQGKSLVRTEEGD